MTTRLATITLLDYGAGNLHSLAKAFAMPEVRVRVETDPRRAADRRTTDLLVLPGVGAFDTAAQRLADARDELRRQIEAGLPILGICLGMQLLFDSSEEGSGSQGLGVIGGTVRRLRATRVPQIGWNSIESRVALDAPASSPSLEVAYYANSFVCQPDDDRCITSWSCYEGDRFPASVHAGPNRNVIGVQFHPEKSSRAGVSFLRALVAGLRERPAS